VSSDGLTNGASPVFGGRGSLVGFALEGATGGRSPDSGLLRMFALAGAWLTMGMETERDGEKLKLRGAVWMGSWFPLAGFGRVFCGRALFPAHSR